MVTIVFESKGGSSKKYANALASKLGCECYDLKEAISNADKIDDVIFVGWRGGPMIAGLKPAKEKFNIIAAINVGLSPEKEKDLEWMKKKNQMDNIFYVRGGMDRTKLSGGQKFFLGLINIKMILFNHSEDDKKVRQVMTKGGSFYSEDQLQPFIDWYNSQ